jgi:hypothetical protein
MMAAQLCNGRAADETGLKPAASSPPRAMDILVHTLQFAQNFSNRFEQTRIDINLRVLFVRFTDKILDVRYGHALSFPENEPICVDEAALVSGRILLRRFGWCNFRQPEPFQVQPKRAIIRGGCVDGHLPTDQCLASFLLFRHACKITHAI